MKATGRCACGAAIEPRSVRCRACWRRENGRNLVCACGQPKDRLSAECRVCRLARRKADSLHPCRDCSELVPRQNTRCRSCWKTHRQHARADDLAAKRDRGLGAMNRRPMDAPINDLNPQARAQRAKGNTWGLGSYRCNRCKKATLMAGLCYSCATGRERTLLRPEERTQQQAAA